MKNQLSENTIKAAIEAIIATKISKDGLNVSKEFKGYISSFGASVIQSGILPALIFFEDKGGAAEDRPLLLQAIMKMNRWETTNEKGVISLVKHYKDEATHQKPLLTSQILQSAIALKLALRTFKSV